MKKKYRIIMIGILLIFSALSIYEMNGYGKIDSDSSEAQSRKKGESDDQQMETSTEKIGKVKLKVLSQYPELPTGCEVTSLAMVLNYYGIEIDKCEIADQYLDKGAVGTVDFRKAFVGDPGDENSYGCYAPVIEKTANRILEKEEASLLAVNLTGEEMDELFHYTEENTPVIIWGTRDCEEGHYSVTWNVNGENLTWFTPEHCMVLVGNDNEKVWVADPIYGDIRSYDRVIFQRSYDSLGKQAIVIQSKK